MEEKNQSLVTLSCKNCATALSSENYCPVCGQKGDTHVLTFRELLEELADGLLNMDSRIWRSLVPLALQPGKLTLEYLRGRRMYYLPPFRLYLILSVLFFLIPSSSNLGEEFSQDLSADLANEGAGITIRPLADAARESDVGTESTELARQIRDEVARELAAAREENPDDYQDADGEKCAMTGLPSGSLFTIVLRDACLKFMNDPERLTQEVIDQVPVMMIVGIPLVALFMFVVYAWSGRYYVEHIIFLFHTHAFFFLISITIALSSVLGQRFGFLNTPMDWFRIIAAWYIPIYIFMAMLRVYGDRATKTFFKGCFILCGYGISIAIVAAFGILYTTMNS